MIDLGLDDGEGPFRLLHLISDPEKNVTLVKYHTSKSCVIFFFLYKVKNRKGYGKGVHFFIIDSIIQIKSKIKEKIELINEQTKIYVPVKLNKIIECKF